MKSLILLSFLTIGSLAMACHPTLQIHAKVSGIKNIYPSTCIITIDPDSINDSATRTGRQCEMYALENGQNPANPALFLTASEVLAKGITVGIINDEPGNCEKKVGDTINTYLVKVPHGIYIDYQNYGINP